MGKPTGFLEYEREESRMQRLLWRESNILMNFIRPCRIEKQQKQGARCMALRRAVLPVRHDDRRYGSPAVRCTI